ncbi:nucleolar protein 14 [Plakobranchus ocellatus]|uniref:Nucleolar protein 14 n=1 Tax=Plakobranchus ocellatus TaxID=259542 RepID=A0AAV3Y014_9GAST|nr:nucleolar protein 14 [Plakobranchus ocellatus]
MGKKGLSDKVRAKRKVITKQPPNPFEVKVNKVKNVVVNKKLQSWEKGLPGVSRSKAVKKRKDTLLRELHHSKKSNFLLDKRFGEGDASLTADEKMVQRFALEKKKQLQKKDFNLDDNEETLTHYGQSLAENLQDTINSDSDNDEDAVKAVTGDLQFGGLSKDDSAVSWKEKMKDIIADSKKMKYERQAEKEKVVETTQELDSVWKTVFPSFSSQPPPAKKKPSNFMLLFHNLVMEQKSSGASDKLKTEEEKAKEEAEKLQVLEAQRLSRMRGETDKPESNHISADDLNDGFTLEKKRQKVSFSDTTKGNESEEEGDEDKGADEAKKDSGELSSDDSDEEENEDDESEDDDDKSSDNFSDLASDENEEEDGQELDKFEETGNDDGKEEVQPKPILKKSQSKQQTSKVSEKIVSDLPFVFSEGNKDKLEKILTYLLQYFGEVVSCDSIDQALLKHVTSHIWEMSQMFPATAASHLQKLLLDKQKEFSDLQHKKPGIAQCVPLNVLLHLPLITGLFPTSDYRHPVTTPAFSFLSQILSECCVRNMKDCITGLFLCGHDIQSVGLSKRYIPEAITFLHGLLVLGADENEAKGVKVFPQLKASGKGNDLLQVKEKCEALHEWSITELLTMDSADLETDKYRCEAIAKCVNLLLDCLNLWEDLTHIAAVIKPVKEPLSMLPVQYYPESLTKAIQQLKTKMRECEAKKLHAMQLPTKKPEALKLFEPKIEEFWSGKRKKGGPNREVNERQRLTHKLKRETKAAVREIKRDNEVLAVHQLEVITKKDAERKRKTKDLMNSLANQEGDYNAIKRAKH